MTLTPEEVKETIMELVKAIDEAGVPEDLRATAFEKGFDALIGVTPTKDAAPDDRPHATKAVATAPSSEGPSIDAIAKRFGIDVEVANEIYYIDGDGSLGLAVAASKFSPKKAPATEDIALLVAAGRQAGGWEEWTAAARIRDVTRDYGRFDSANFASTIKRMGAAFSFRGRGHQIEVRVTRPGFESAATLARELSGM